MLAKNIMKCTKGIAAMVSSVFYLFCRLVNNLVFHLERRSSTVARNAKMYLTRYLKTKANLRKFQEKLVSLRESDKRQFGGFRRFLPYSLSKVKTNNKSQPQHICSTSLMVLLTVMVLAVEDNESENFLLNFEKRLMVKYDSVTRTIQEDTMLIGLDFRRNRSLKCIPHLLTFNINSPQNSTFRIKKNQHLPQTSSSSMHPNHVFPTISSMILNPSSLTIHITRNN
ncbi:hypothetical protein YC2023_052925 [Brassica napus]